MDAKQATGVHIPTLGWMVVILVVALVVYHLVAR